MSEANEKKLGRRYRPRLRLAGLDEIQIKKRESLTRPTYSADNMTRQLVGIDGGSIDDRAALLHVGDRRLGEIEHRVDIDLEGQLPFVIGDVFERFETRLMGGIVDENIETAQLGNGLLDHRPALCRIADVARHEDGLASGVLDKAFRLVGVVVFAEIGNQDIGSLARKGNCHRPADAAICAGYDRLLPRELATTPIAVLTVVGVRLGKSVKVAAEWHSDGRNDDRSARSASANAIVG